MTFFSVPGALVASFGVALAWRSCWVPFLCVDHVIKAGTPSPSLFLLPAFPDVADHLHRARAVAIVLHRRSQACRSFAYSLRTQPTSRGRLLSPRYAVRCLSSSRPAASPVTPLHRGRSYTVSLCPHKLLLHLLRVAVSLCALLIGPSIHCSHRTSSLPLPPLPSMSTEVPLCCSRSTSALFRSG